MNAALRALLGAVGGGFEGYGEQQRRRDVVRQQDAALAQRQAEAEAELEQRLALQALMAQERGEARALSQQDREREREFRMQQEAERRAERQAQREAEERLRRDLAAQNAAVQREVAGARAEAARAQQDLKPPTADQATSAGFARRMLEAEKRLGDLVAKNPRASEQTVREAVAGGIPFVGSALASLVRPEDRQLFDAAATDWVRAKLRRESGAVIGEQEMADEIRSYFPRIGDAPATRDQKEAQRLTALEAMLGQGGRGIEPDMRATADSLVAARRARLSPRQALQQRGRP